jgi:hypothetical protein
MLVVSAKGVVDEMRPAGKRPRWLRSHRTTPGGVDRHVSSTWGAFVRALVGIAVSAASVGQTAVAPRHIISRVFGVG